MVALRSWALLRKYTLKYRGSLKKTFSRQVPSTIWPGNLPITLPVPPVPLTALLRLRPMQREDWSFVPLRKLMVTTSLENQVITMLTTWVQSVPATRLRAAYDLVPQNLLDVLCNRRYYDPHFTGGKTEDQKYQDTCLRSQGWCKFWSQDLNAGTWFQILQD